MIECSSESMYGRELAPSPNYLMVKNVRVKNPRPFVPEFSQLELEQALVVCVCVCTVKWQPTTQRERPHGFKMCLPEISTNTGREKFAQTHVDKTNRSQTVRGRKGEGKGGRKV